MKIHKDVRDIFASEEEDGLYCIFKRIYTPHISVLQREINCLNRENENHVFGEHIDFDLQNAVQSHSFDENRK